jgi:hypothetical protein
MNAPLKPKFTFDGQKLTPAKIKAFQDTYRKWPSAGIRWISDDGEAFIMNTKIDLPCGCSVTGNGTLQFPLTVKQCALHTATPDLLEAFKRAESAFEDIRTHWRPSAPHGRTYEQMKQAILYDHEAISTAIAKAKGEQ